MISEKLRAMLAGRAEILKGAPLRSASLRLAYLGIAIMLILGLYTLLWVASIKDLGLSINWTGEILAVSSQSPVADEGVMPGDYVSFSDYQRLKTFMGEAGEGQTIDVEVHRALAQAPASSGDFTRTVTLTALPGTISRRISLGVEVVVGILFSLLGLAPLVARRRDLSLWLFFLATQTTALFLISDVPRSYHVLWAEIASYSSFVLFPALLFHFHTLFPQPALGARRQASVVAVYMLALALLPLNLISVFDYAFYVSDPWQLTIGLYLGATLLSCLTLLARTFAKTADTRARAQVRIVFLCSTLGLLSNALLWVPSVLFSLDTETDGILKALSVFTALSVPIGYSYAMLRYDALIGGVLWRPALMRMIFSSVLSFALVAFLSLILPFDGDFNGRATLSIWGSILLLVVALSIFYEWATRWMETHLFKGGNYVFLLASLTDQMSHFRGLDEFVVFFRDTFPARFKSTGTAVYLAQKPSNAMRLFGSSLGVKSDAEHVLLNLSVDNPLAEVMHSPDDELLNVLRAAGGPVELHSLMVSHVRGLSTHLDHFLASLKDAGVAWLLPLVSSQQQGLIGLVALGGKETDEAYTAQEITALAALVRTASVSAENVLTFASLEKRLDELHQERELSASLVRDLGAAQDKERTRIASEIHDTVLQELAVVQRLLTRLRDHLQYALGGVEDTVLALDALELKQTEYARQAKSPNFVLVQPDTHLPSVDEMHRLGTASPHTLATAALRSMLTNCQNLLGGLLGESVPDLAPPQPRSPVSSREIPASPAASKHAPENSDAGGLLIEDVLSMVRATNQRLRDICTDLHPAYLDAPVVKTLARSVEQFRALNPHTRIELDVSGSEQLYIGDNVKALCKKVAEQAIHNAINHGVASRIRVSLAFGGPAESLVKNAPSEEEHIQFVGESTVALRIEDDGIGFEPHTPAYWRGKRHHGLASMYESAALNSGWLHITSAPDKGTEVLLWMSQAPTQV